MYKRVVVPLDGSPFAESVLPFLREIAGPLDVEVVLVRVVQPEPLPVFEQPEKVLRHELETRREDAEEYLAPIAVDLRGRGIRVTTVVRRGQPAAELLALARETHADLIAMSTHARRGFDRFVFGSVAEAVLRLAGIPVLLLKPSDAEAPGAETMPPSTERTRHAP